MIAVLRKAFDILELLALDPETPILLSGIVEKTGLNQPTCARILQTLVKAGYVEKYGKRSGYILGPMAYLLSEKGTYRSHLKQIVQPIVDELAEEIGETVIFTVFKGGRRFILAIANGNPEIEVKINPYFNDLYLSAAGRVLLSYSGEDALKKFSDENGFPGGKWGNITTWKGLGQAAAGIREKGFCEESNSPVLSKMAYPVFKDKEFIGVLAIRVPKVSFKGENKKKCIAAVEQAVGEIEKRIKRET